MAEVNVGKWIVLFISIILQFSIVYSRIHRLKIENDKRRQIDLSTFGFLKGGYIAVNVTNFQFSTTKDNKDLKDYVFGFTLDKTVSPGISPYLESKPDECVLTDKELLNKDNALSVIFFTMELQENRMVIARKGKDLERLNITLQSEEEYNLNRGKREIMHSRKKADILSDTYLMPHRRRRRATAEDGSSTSGNVTPSPGATLTTPAPAVSGSTESPPKSSNGTVIDPKDVKLVLEGTDKMLVNDSIQLHADTMGRFSVYFLVAIEEEEQEGLYNLYFHNCHNYQKDQKDIAVNLTIRITENNNGNYLSAGKMPLPKLYFSLCVVYLFTGCFWIYVLRSSNRNGEMVFKTHYLMCVLVFIKAVALLFHAINYYFIEKEGHHEEAWAILYYITMLMKGALLFTTIVLIGAGWAFVKYILSDRDKKIFIIVIPLQILANIAQIIIEETEEGQSQYTMWKEIFILVDLLCCGAILFPVVWSIRHLQEGSQTDGKAAINLAKLKIFRHFYILIVCYIYFTRIIVYLLRITVPFQYEWLDELFKEAATFVFFVVTGYKFRPASNNPYLQVSTDSDDEVEMDQVLTESGVYDSVVKVNVKHHDGDTTGPSKRESSHDYD